MLTIFLGQTCGGWHLPGITNQCYYTIYWEQSMEDKICESPLQALLARKHYTVYVVYLAVILNWHFGGFFVHQQNLNNVIIYSFHSYYTYA